MDSNPWQANARTSEEMDRTLPGIASFENSIKFEEKIDIDDLVLPPKQTGTPNMDTSNIKQEPVENLRSEMEKEITLLFEELDMTMIR